MRAIAALSLFVLLAACSTAGAVVSGVISEGAEANTCRPAGPHDAAGPGDVVCRSPDGEERARSSRTAN